MIIDTTVKNISHLKKIQTQTKMNVNRQRLLAIRNQEQFIFTAGNNFFGYLKNISPDDSPDE